MNMIMQQIADQIAERLNEGLTSMHTECQITGYGNRQGVEFIELTIVTPVSWFEIVISPVRRHA